MSQTVQDLVDQVRSQLDEENTESVSDTNILNALNRAQRHATNITSRRYEDLFWYSVTVPLVAGQSDYAIPDAAFGRRIEKIEIQQGSIVWEVKRLANQDASPFVTQSQSMRPYYYSLRKNIIRLYPQPAGGTNIVIHYQLAPQNLVKPQGRITEYGTDSGFPYVLVDTLGADLSTSVTGFGSYVSVVDYTTGDIKGTLQIASAPNTTLNQVKFKFTGLTRSTVLGKTVSTSLPSTIEADDYICLVTGTCVPELPEAYTDYLIQYALVDIKRDQLGEPVQDSQAHLDRLEREIERMWVGRESSNRVRKSSTHWNTTLGGDLRRLLS